jgi:hypothetical protein
MFLNLSKDIFGILPSDGTTYQETSYGRRARALPGTLGEFQKKCVDLRPGETFTMAEIDGPGLITRIWVTLPRWPNPGALRNLVFRTYWDGESEPSVLVPLGDLFGATFATRRDYFSAYLAITSGAYLSFFPMPFRKRAEVTVQNQSKLPVRLFFYQVTYLKLGVELPLDIPYFHCLWHREEMPRGGEPFTVLRTSGSGFYLGCHVNMEGRGWPWRLNPLHTQLPEGLGMGMLEGWERMWIDGADEPNVHGTGGEDYFNGAWYFTGVPSTHLTHGVTRRSYATRRVSCYRFHAEMPVSFRSGIRVTLDHGLDNRLPAAYDGAAYWYQREPHDAFGELAPAAERRASSAISNRLIMAAPLACAGAGLAAALKLRKSRPC